jgi:hypothetical protein
VCACAAVPPPQGEVVGAIADRLGQTAPRAGAREPRDSRFARFEAAALKAGIQKSDVYTSDDGRDGWKLVKTILLLEVPLTLAAAAAAAAMRGDARAVV